MPKALKEALQWIALVPAMCLFTGVFGLLKSLFEDWSVLGHASVSLAASFAWMTAAFFFAPRGPRIVGAVALGFVYLVIGGLTVASILIGLGVLPGAGEWERRNTLDLVQGVTWLIGSSVAFVKLRREPEFAK